MGLAWLHTLLFTSFLVSFQRGRFCSQAWLLSLRGRFQSQLQFQDKHIHTLVVVIQDRQTHRPGQTYNALPSPWRK